MLKLACHIQLIDLLMVKFLEWVLKTFSLLIELGLVRVELCCLPRKQFHFFVLCSPTCLAGRFSAAYLIFHNVETMVSPCLVVPPGGSVPGDMGVTNTVVPIQPHGAFPKQPYPINQHGFLNT